MGIFRIQSRTSGNCYLYATPDLKSLMNRYRFQLGAGSHPDRALQAEWNERGGGDFDFEVLERLDYDKDESRADYSEDLELLRLIWEDKLKGAGELTAAAGR